MHHISSGQHTTPCHRQHDDDLPHPVMGLAADPSVLVDEVADVEVGAEVLPVDQVEVLYRAQSGVLVALIEPDSTRVGGDDV